MECAQAERLPAFATLNPRRALEIRPVDGTLQAVAWDVAAGTRRVVTSWATGVDVAKIEPDGEHIWWFEADLSGQGRWLRQPFGGGPAKPAMKGLPVGRMYGIVFDHKGSTAAVTIGVGEESRCYVGEPGGQSWLVSNTSEYLGLVGISPDGRTLVMAGRPDGENAIHLCTIPPGGNVVQLAGRSGWAQWPMEFNPDPDAEQELLFVVERHGEYVVATWRAGSGIRVHDWLAFDSEIGVRWYGRGREVLVRNDRAGRSAMHVADLNDRTAKRLPTPDGTILTEAPAPGGQVRYIWTRADLPARTLVVHPDEPAAVVPGPVTSPLRRQEIWIDQVHSFLTTPDGGGPWPTVFLVHGGPAEHDRDRYDPQVEALAEAGFAVVRANYRGSTGYGPQWRYGFGTKVGLAQLEDLAAVRRHLIELGVSFPGGVGLAGSSWGGYLALLAMGVQPQYWAAASAAFPIADYVAAHFGTTPALREMDEDLFGGGPADVPDRYRAASPMTYVDSVRGPVQLVSSRTDEKCPADQVEQYAAALGRRGVRHELTWVAGGRDSLDAADRASVVALTLKFLLEHLPAARRARPGAAV